jgi:hypothetical protein
MKFLLMPLELVLMVFVLARNCITATDDDCSPEPAILDNAA